MKIQNLLKMLLVVTTASLFGCGGGGGGGGTPAPATPVAAKTTVSGKVDFPVLTSLVGKRVYALTDPVFIQAYTIDGKASGSQVTVNPDGTFSIPNLDSGIDYVLKATRGQQILKKLIEKSLVAPGVTVPNQDLSGVSSTAVVVASQKLAAATGVAALNLGEPVTLTETQKTTLSTKIFTDVSPQALETTISQAATTVQTALASNDLSSLTATLADLVNTLNIVIAAVSQNNDPAKVISGQVASFTVPDNSLLLLQVDNSGAVTQSATATTTVTSSVAASIVTSSVAAYVPPPRVQLDISTDVAANTLFGVTLDITVPVDVQVKLDATNNPDMASISLAAGVSSGTIIAANYTPASRKLRVVIAGSTPLLTGNLLSIVFDRTAGSTITSTSFVTAVASTVDINGQHLTSGFNVIKTAVTSGI